MTQNKQWNNQGTKQRQPFGAGAPSSTDVARVTGDLLRKVPPHNLEAEQAVLGGVFLRNDVLHDLVDLISGTDFYSPAHRMVYESFLALFQKSSPIDMITVQDALEKQGVLNEVGGAVYLAELAGSVVSASNAKFYAEIVRDLSVRRGLINASASIIENGFDNSIDVKELLSASEQSIFEIAEARSSRSFAHGGEVLVRVAQKLDKLRNNKDLITGVPSGWADLDDLTNGFQPTDLVILAARPAMGKTALALNIALNAAGGGSTVAVFSLEMGDEQLVMRLLSMLSRVDLRDLRRGHLDDRDWDSIYAVQDTLSQLPLFIDDTPGLSPTSLRANCRRLKREHGLDLVVVDYLQLMQSSKRTDSREQEISDISRNLKILAKELEIPVIALSQLNRKVEERTDKRPKLSDLRESGAIEQDADMILFLYRDDVYKDKHAEPDNKAEVIIGKHRNGPTGQIMLRFDKEHTAFDPLRREEWNYGSGPE